MAIYLDIETVDFFQDPAIAALPRSEQMAAMRFGLATTYAPMGDWRTWYAEDLMNLWQYLINRNEIVIGWNLIDFDFPVIEHNLNRLFDYTTADLDPVHCLDIFAQIRADTGRWYKLDTVARANLGRGKSADGQQAAEWIRTNDPELIRKAADYCRDDVQLTYELHQILLRGETLKLPARPEKQETSDILWRQDNWKSNS